MSEIFLIKSIGRGCFSPLSRVGDGVLSRAVELGCKRQHKELEAFAFKASCETRQFTSITCFYERVRSDFKREIL